jgi:hypothetical protein
VGNFLFGSGVLATDVANAESGLLTLWATAHADGWKIVSETLIPYNPFAVGAANAIQGPAAVNTWMRGQSKSTLNTPSGQYYDQLSQVAADLSYPMDPNVFIQVGTGQNHLSDNGNYLRYGRINAVLLNRLTFPTGLQGRIITDGNNNNTALNLNDTPYLDTPNVLTNTNFYDDLRILPGTSMGGNVSVAPFYSVQYDANGPHELIRTTTLGGTFTGKYFQFPGGVAVQEVAPKDFQRCYSQTANNTAAAPTVCVTVDATTPTQVDLSLPGSPNTPGADLGVRNLTVIGTCTGCSGSGGIANTTATVGTTTINANTCTSTTTVTMTGVATSSVFDFTPTTDTSGVTGWGSTGGLVIVAWPTANTLNYKVCNQTTSNITPGASVTFNVGAR